MHCREAEPLLSAFHDGELGRSEQEAVRAHLLDCPACRSRAADLRSISRWLSPEEAPEVPGGFTDRVLARLRAGEGLDELGDERRSWRSLRWISVAAAFLLTTGSLYLAIPDARSGAFHNPFGAAPLDAAATDDVDREIERNDALARAAWVSNAASKPAAAPAK